MFLPFGEMGIHSLPNDAVLMPQLKQSIPERGFYFFPGMDRADKMSDAAQKQWAEKIRRGPQGIVIFDPAGSEPMPPSQLGTELLSNILACLLLAIVLATTRASRMGRVGLATLLGVFAWMAIDVSYWNWYRFPTALTIASLVDQGVGALLAGVVIALVLGRPRSAAASAPPAS